MIWPLLQTAIVDGLLFSLIGIALLISFGWLRFPDLTPDGSFVLGGAAFGAVALHGWNLWMAMSCAAISGALAGAATSSLALKLRIPPVIASLITVTGLYSVSWLIMARPTVFLTDDLIIWGNQSALLTVALLVSAIAVVVALLAQTLFGLRMRALGENPLVGDALGIGAWRYTCAGLAISNAIAAMAGALFAQRVFVADINSGFGVTLTALVPVFAAGALVSSPRSLMKIICIVVAVSIAYRLIFGAVLLADVRPEMYRLISAICLVAVFAVLRGRAAFIASSLRWS